ncbi:MAG: aminoacyl-tRNA hydrolase, partial [Firmicutes bacterium]|nr:aminoacyl-tRNA hydrolase [Bacillota bacterium]
VRDIARFYKIPLSNVIVIFDDVSLPPGKIRIRKSGSDGGHNGMKNIIYLTGDDQIPRIKIGVGEKPHPDADLASWVLSGFKPDDVPRMKQAFENACAAAALMVEGKIDTAMNLYNG